MMMKESDIIFESGKYWIFNAKQKGFEVYKTGITHSTRCAQIGWTGQVGLDRAKQEIKRRQEIDDRAVIHRNH
jgi:hypothetical protein